MEWFIICFFGLFCFTLVKIGQSFRVKKFQKLWEKEKAMRLRIDPTIPRERLCEHYVMFCKRNNCKVEY